MTMRASARWQAAVVALLAGLGFSWQASADVLLDNLEGALAGDVILLGQTGSQCFTTGSISGYSLETIETRVDTPSGIVGDLHEDSHTGAIKSSLTASVSGNVITFTPPSAVALDASTTYCLLFATTSSDPMSNFARTTASNAETGLSGWSVANESHVWNTGSWIAQTTKFYLVVNGSGPPEVSISGGAAVTEGGDATFTVTANPTPDSALSVDLTITESGDFVASTNEGAKTVTVPTSGSVDYTVATVDDSTTEDDGTVTATLNAGTGYHVRASANAAKVTVNDNDGLASISSVAITSTPSHDANSDNTNDTYGRDDVIKVTVTYSADVTWAVPAGADMRTRMRIGSNVRTLSLETGGATSGTASSLVFARTVVRSDEDTDGVEMLKFGTSNRVIGLVGSATLKDASNTDVSLEFATLDTSAQANHKVDGDLDPPTTNNPPVFSGQDDSASVDENSAANTAVATITATDPDTGDTITYSLDTTSDAVFDIGSSTGAITVQSGATLDHEATSSITATVTATDNHGAKATHDVEVTINDVAEPPAAPGAPTVAGASINSVDVTWTAPTNTGKPAISDYDVQYKTSAESSWTAHSFTGTGTTATIASLTAGTTYDVQVMATNAEGDSTWSDTGSGATHVTITIAADATAVDEGTAAAFTLTANPAAPADLTVNLDVADATGSDFVASGDEGDKTVTISSGGTSAAYSVATQNDSTDEPNGPVTVTVSTGTGYTVGTTSSAQVTVRDDDTASNNPATGAPTISGFPQVGQTLTAATGGIADPDGLTGVSYSHQWIRVDGSNETNITGATSSTYALAAADSGKTIKVKVTFSDDAGNNEALTSTATGTVVAAAPACTTGNVWCATLTVGEGTRTTPVAKSKGYCSGITTTCTTAYGSLSDTSIALFGNDYTVQSVRWGGSSSPGGRLHLTLNSAFPAGGLSLLTLKVDSNSFELSDATQANQRGAQAGNYRWATAPAAIRGYAAGRQVTVELLQADPTITITAGTSPVTEGTAAAFTVTADGAPGADLTVNLSVSESSGSDYVAPGDQGDKTVTINAGDTSASYSVTTQDDSTDEDNGTVTVTVSTGTGYAVGTASSADVAVNDNDDPPAGNNAPVFTGQPASATVPENSAAGTAVEKVVATDADGDAIEYSLDSTSDAVFDIHATSGAITVASGADLNHEGTNSYSATVTANDGTATTDHSITIGVGDVDEPPTAPGAPNVVAASTSSVTVTWTAPTNTGKPAISGYDLRYQASGASDWTELALTGTGTSTIIGSLLVGTTYNVQVKAKNDEGASGWSATGSGATNAATPTISSVTISSTPGYDADNDGTADTYVSGDTINVDVTFSEAVTVTGGNANVRLRLDLGTDDTTLANSRRTMRLASQQNNNTTLRFGYTVVAADTDTDGLWVQTATATNTQVVFLANNATIASTASGTAADLTKSGLDTSGDDDHKVDGSRSADTTAPGFSSATVNGTTLVVTFDETLQAGKTKPASRIFTVTATPSGGDARTLNGATTAVTISGAAVTATLDTAVAHGEAVTVAYVKPAANAIEDLSGNEAANFNGEDATNNTSAPANNAPVFTNQPTSASVDENSAGGTEVTTVVATDADGDAIEYSLDSTSDAVFDIHATSGAITVASGATLDHEAKASYSATVTASDGTATTDHGITIAVDDVREPPTAPGAPTVTGASTASVTVTWTAPSTAGIPAISGYDVQYKTSAQTNWTAHTHSGTGTTATIASLSAGTTYNVQVKAKNAEGDSTWSDTGSGATHTTITITGGSAVTEGTAAVFTVTANPAAPAALTVNLSVADATGSDFVASGNEGAQTVAISSGGTSANYSVATVGDTTDEPDGPVTVTVNSGTGYTVGTTASASVTVNDDDDPPSDTNVPAACGDGGDSGPFFGADTILESSWTVGRTSVSFDSAQSLTLSFDVCDSAGTTTTSTFEFTDENRSATISGLNAGSDYWILWRYTSSTVTNESEWKHFRTLAPANNAPTVANTIPDQTARVGTALSFQFAANAFNDADGDTLTYAATKSDDTALPSWLSFTAGTRTFAGTPATSDIGTVSVKVTASDGNGGSVSDTFDIVVKAANRAPTVANAIPDQTATVGTALSFQFEANAFNDADGDTLTYAATKSDDTALPAWLSFTAGTRTFAGTPGATDTGTLSVKVTASDGNGGSVSDTFDITVSAANNAPVFTGQPASATVPENSAGGTAVATVVATDADGDAIGYSLDSTSDAVFDIHATSGAITVGDGATLDHEATASYPATVTANDGTATTDHSITLRVDDVDEPPAAPGAPNVTGASTASVTVTWTAPSTTGIPAISGYDVQYKTSVQTNWTAHTHSGTGTTATIASLATGTTYNVQVKAKNAEGASDWSDAGSGATHTTITITGGSQVTEGTAAVFTVTSNPAAPADLTVNLSVADATGTSDFVASGNEGPKSVTVSSGETSADYSVATVDDSTDEPDGTVTVTVGTGTGYTVGTTSSAGVTVNDDDDPAAPCAASTNDFWDESTEITVSSTATTITVSGTTTGTNNTIALCKSSGETSADYSVATVDDSTDEPDATVTVTVGTGTGYTVGTTSSAGVPIRTKAAPANNAPVFTGQPATAAVNENSAGGTAVTTVVATDADGDALEYSLDTASDAVFDIHATSGAITVASGADLNHEGTDSYSATVTANDGTATTDHSITLRVDDVNEPPAAPGAPNVSGASTSSVTVSWTAPSTTGIPAINDYDVQFKTSEQTNWTDHSFTGTATSTTIASLAAGTTYNVQVKAKNAEGASDWSTAGSGATHTTITITGGSQVTEGTAAVFTVTSNPAATYVRGDTISVDVTFSEAVTVTGGNANVRLRLDLGADDTTLGNSRRTMSLASLQNSNTTLRFGYQVATADTDTDGVWVQTASATNDRVVFLVGTATITSTASGTAAVLTQSGLPTSGDDDHQVNGGRAADTTAPGFQSATVDGTTLVVTFDETLQAGKTKPASSIFTVTATPSGGSPRTLAGAATAVTISGAAVTATLGTAVAHGEAVTVAYAKPAANAVEDLSGNEAANFSDGATTNNTAAPTNNAPVFTGQPTSATVPENSAADTVVETITATDSDTGDTVSYSLDSTSDAVFDIHATSGVITVGSGATLNHEATSSYPATVTATDNRGAGATHGLTINVGDVNEPPAAPAQPTVTAASTTSVSASWAAPANTGPAINDYDVQYRASGASDWIAHNFAGTGTSTTIASLIAGTTYEVQVKAKNPEGESGWSPTGSGATSNPTITIAADASPVNEGTAAAFTVTADSAPGADLTVNLSVSESSGSDYVASGDEGDQTVTIDAGETEASYSVTTQDDSTDEQNGTVTVTVSTGTGYTVGTTSSAEVAVNDNDDPPPTNNPPTGSVTIDGTPTQGETLTAVTSTVADADGLGTFAYQWTRGTTAIGGANSSTYTLVQADVGSTITVTVSWTDDGGTAESLTSAATAPVANVNDDPTGAVTIAGTATQGQTLTADASAVADADGLGAFSYQWNRGTTAITGANSSTYTLVLADVGSTITVTVTYTDGQGSVESVTSAATGTVVGLNSAPVFTNQDTTASVDENSAGGTAVATITATDADGDAIAYSLDSTADAVFDIDASSGAITVGSGAVLDYEATTSYAATVTASDGTATAEHQITIGVNDLDEPPPAPGAPGVAGASTTSVDVTWTAPSTTGIPAINDYDVRYQVSGATDWTAHAFAGTGTSTTITGLAVGTTYNVQVQAENDEARATGRPPAAARRTAPTTPRRPSPRRRVRWPLRRTAPAA